MQKAVFLFVILLGLASCTSDAEPTDTTSSDDVSDQVEPTEDIISFPEDAKYNELALFLAAETGSPEGLFNGFESENIWTKYKTSIDNLWKKTNEKVPTMRSWSTEQLSDMQTEGGTLFYPFSGPDFLHADIFFPNYDTIVMIGLEPIGTYPAMDLKMQDTLGQQYLNGIYKSMNAILGLSFFRTIAMADDFKGEVDGTLPVLMHFMVRTGHEVMYQERVGVLPSGELTTNFSLTDDSTYVGNRFYYRKKGEENVRVLNYFAVNLQDTPYTSRGGLEAKGLETRTDFVNYLNGLNIRATYIKSASYLLHYSSFSIVRDIILDESEFILQDDSGVLLKDFDPEVWDLTFYGTYTKPINLFSQRMQNDLKQHYDSTGIDVQDLPFGIGYQYRNGTSNLLRATKK
ncbi:MAG: hypothetical protein QNK23_11525 [Crocinitomicaceae bacterium]|nr:hypothetical protein [Crocinitomicaceae bacterium]